MQWLYGAEHGCKWRGWHTVYTRMRRRTKAGVMDRMFDGGLDAQT